MVSPLVKIITQFTQFSISHFSFHSRLRRNIFFLSTNLLLSYSFLLFLVKRSTIFSFYNFTRGEFCVNFFSLFFLIKIFFNARIRFRMFFYLLRSLYAYCTLLIIQLRLNCLPRINGDFWFSSPRSPKSLSRTKIFPL